MSDGTTIFGDPVRFVDMDLPEEPPVFGSPPLRRRLSFELAMRNPLHDRLTEAAEKWHLVEILGDPPMLARVSSIATDYDRFATKFELTEVCAPA